MFSRLFTFLVGARDCSHSIFAGVPRSRRSAEGAPKMRRRLKEGVGENQVIPSGGAEAVTAMPSFSEHREEARSDSMRRSCWDSNLAPRSHGTREDRGDALLASDALGRARPIRGCYDIPFEGAAMPACLPQAHRPALVLWRRKRVRTERESEEPRPKQSRGAENEVPRALRSRTTEPDRSRTIEDIGR